MEQGTPSGCDEMSRFNLAQRLVRYAPPEWAKALEGIPEYRLRVAQLPTPIHKWSLPGVKDKFEVSIKRDDLTGAALSGNKIRKLEFLLASALRQKCDHVITMGGVQSNHCRATAVIARQLGLQPHLLLRSKDMDPSVVGCQGNVLVNRLMGAQIVLCPYRSTYETLSSSGTTLKGLGALMEEYAQTLRVKGCNPYVIPVGGSNLTGLWGYIEAFGELIEQGVLEQFDDVIVAVGSGGTVAGMAISNHLTGSKLRVHGVCVCDSAEYFYSESDRYLQELGLTDMYNGKPISSRDIMNLVDGFKGLGYAVSTTEELKALTEISSQTGILLDRVYTLKAVKGMLALLNQYPTRLKGSRVLFIHTGGMHSLFDGQLDDVLKTSRETNKVYQLKEFVDYE